MDTTVAPGRTKRSAAVLGVFAILAATACWSSGGVLAEKADGPSTIVAFWRFLIVSAVFGILAAATGRRITWPMLRRSLPGGMLFGVNLTVFFQALKFATVGMATVFAALVPVLALIAGRALFGERISRLAVLCAAAAVGGVVIFVVPSLDEPGNTATGVLLSLLAVLIWVSYLLVTKRARQGVGTVEYLLCMSAVAAITLVPFMLLFTEEGVALPEHGWSWIVLLALLPGSVGHGLLAWAQAHVPMSTAGVLLQCEPIGAAVAAAIFLGEPLGALQVLGLAVAFAGVAVLTRATTTTTPTEEAVG